MSREPRQKRLFVINARAGGGRALSQWYAIRHHFRNELESGAAKAWISRSAEEFSEGLAERLSGLRDSVPVGAALTMQAGSAAQILLAWEDSEKIHRGLVNARFTATQLSADRRRGWAQSVGEREAGVASVSAPVRGPNGKVIAAVSISGPIERLGRQPGRIHAAAVVATAARLTEHLTRE
jgi:hypothetical protein